MRLKGRAFLTAVDRERVTSVAGIRALLVAVLAGCATTASGPRGDVPRIAESDVRKPRVLVTTDPELDDSNSLLRYLLYSTDFRTEGLVYASSQFHWKGDGTGKKRAVPNREYSRFGPHPTGRGRMCRAEGRSVSITACGAMEA